jgi:hypothetical protein
LITPIEHFLHDLQMVHPEPFIGMVEDIVDSGVGSPPAQSPESTALTMLAQELGIGKQGE